MILWVFSCRKDIRKKDVPPKKLDGVNYMEWVRYYAGLILFLLALFSAWRNAIPDWAAYTVVAFHTIANIIHA